MLIAIIFLCYRNKLYLHLWVKILWVFGSLWFLYCYCYLCVFLVHFLVLLLCFILRLFLVFFICFICLWVLFVLLWC